MNMSYPVLESGIKKNKIEQKKNEVYENVGIVARAKGINVSWWSYL